MKKLKHRELEEKRKLLLGMLATALSAHLLSAGQAEDICILLDANTESERQHVIDVVGVICECEPEDLGAAFGKAVDDLLPEND